MSSPDREHRLQLAVAIAQEQVARAFEQRAVASIARVAAAKLWPLPELMGFRFYRRVHLAPGIGVNLSRSGPSLTVGVRGAHVTFGARGVTKTVGLPGTGIYYTSRHGYHSGYHSARSNVALDASAQAAATRRLELTLVFVLVAVLFIFALLAIAL